VIWASLKYSTFAFMRRGYLRAVSGGGLDLRAFGQLALHGWHVRAARFLPLRDSWQVVD
jgi:hypothetical protein